MVLGFFKKIGEKVAEKISSLYSGKKVDESRIFDGDKYSNKAERTNAYEHWKWENFGVMPVFFADTQNAVRKEKLGWDEEDKLAEKEKDRYELAREKILKRRNNKYLFSREKLNSMPIENVSRVGLSEDKSNPSGEKLELVKNVYNKIVDYFSGKNKKEIDYSLDKKFKMSGEKRVKPFDIFDTSTGQLNSISVY